MRKNDILKKTLKEFGIFKELRISSINNVLINSAELKKDDLFVAIRGGNNYINEALEKDAYVIYDDKTKEFYHPKAFFVEDSIRFLQEFARNWRNNLELKIIGITGSNGKTTVKDIVYQLLSSKFKGKKTEGNLNNHIGLPVTLLRAEKTDDFLVLEMGMSDFGEIDTLASIAKPDYGIITNIGDSHLEFLGSRKNVFKAKTEMIKHVKEKMFLNGDDPFLRELNGIKISVEDLSVSDYKAQNIILTNEGTEFILNNNYKLKTNLIGKHNIQNLLLALAVAGEFGVEAKEIKSELEEIRLTAMRFQKIKNNNIIYINDAYNASPVSMEKAILTFSEIYNDRYKILILGDMLELGNMEAEFHENLEHILRKTKQNEIILYGPLMKNLYEKIRDMNVFHYGDKQAIKNKLKEYKTKELAVLLKGSRGMKLEEIIPEGN